MKVKSEVILAEPRLFFIRISEANPSTVAIHGYKKHFGIAALPQKHAQTVLKAFKDPFPDFEAEKNAFVVGMSNPNTTDHPPPTLLNVG